MADIAANLIPPHDADAEKIWRWRVYLIGVVFAMAATIGTHIALACGFLPAIFPGFASAAEVTNISQQQQVMRVESLEDTLYTMKKDQCIAQSTGNLQAAQTQDQRIRDKLVAYKQVSGGQRYELPPCELFVSRK
ncbi:MAG TPA: hypothetical protein VGN16_09485 [Acidobacteriaceae bacterium]